MHPDALIDQSDFALGVAVQWLYPQWNVIGYHILVLSS
jgi:hypothetical protein